MGWWSKGQVEKDREFEGWTVAPGAIIEHGTITPEAWEAVGKMTKPVVAIERIDGKPLGDDPNEVLKVTRVVVTRPAKPHIFRHNGQWYILGKGSRWPLRVDPSDGSWNGTSIGARIYSEAVSERKIR